MTGAPWITTSWDDGHALDLRLADLLRHYNIPATFYIPRSAPRGVLSESQIRELSESFEIGAHTLDHVYLTEVDDARAAGQIRDSKSWLQDVTGRPCTMFCPPAGKYTTAHLKMIRDAGFTGIRTVELLSLDLPRQSDGLLITPTTIQVHPHGRSAYIRNAVKRRAWSNLFRFAACGFAPTWHQIAQAVLKRLSSGSVFHLWGHSWELEHTAQWTRLEDILKLISDRAPDFHFAPNGVICSAACAAPTTPITTSHSATCHSTPPPAPSTGL
ncbi:MAG TPA: polysaccharide deacetylase family protein [Tepidisphaeraceae bacterium]|nr:polysaccharide deacetylase family protein [Tepidisphaeraceae bacterium]